MNKYELALVVSAKIDDDARTAVVDKAKAIIEKAGGTITNVDEKGKLSDRQNTRLAILWCIACMQAFCFIFHCNKTLLWYIVVTMI